MQTMQQQFVVSYHKDALMRPRSFTDSELNGAVVKFMTAFNEQGEEQVQTWRVMQTEADFYMAAGAGVYIDLTVGLPAGCDEGESLRKIVDAMNNFLFEELGIRVVPDEIDIREMS